MASSQYWANQISDLASDYRIVAIDTRGHGRSVLLPGPLSYARYADDVMGVMDALSIDQAHIVGWSDGAITGLQAALVHPQRVRSLFAFGANFDHSGLIAGGGEAPTFREFARRCAAEYARLNPHPSDWGQLRERLRALWRSEPHYTRTGLANIQCRTTVCAGRHDEIIHLQHARIFAASVNEAQLEVLDSVSHFGMLQAPRAFTDLIRHHLGRD